MWPSAYYSAGSLTCTLLSEHKVYPQTTEFPIQSPSEDDPPSTTIPITVHLPEEPHGSSLPLQEAPAAVKIQSAYRSYVVRTLVKKISAVISEANDLERLIQLQDTVDAVRTSELERFKMNEKLMVLLLRLDSVPGIDPAIRELRRNVSRRIVALQEIVDAVSDTKVENWVGFLNHWDGIVENMEKEACDERGGGHELEKFCAEHLGFRCLQRFLSD